MSEQRDKSSTRERSRERNRDRSRARDSSRVRDRSAERGREKGHKKSDTLTVEPYTSGRGSSRSRPSSPRDGSPPGEIRDRSFGPPGGGYGNYAPTPGYGGSTLQGIYSPTSPTKPHGQYPPPGAPLPPGMQHQAPYGSAAPYVAPPYGAGAPPFPVPGQAPPLAYQYPPPVPSAQPAPYGSVTSPTITSGGYQYQIPPAPIPPPSQTYPPAPHSYGAPPPSKPEPQLSTTPPHTNPDYYGDAPNPPHWSSSTSTGPSHSSSSLTASGGTSGGNSGAGTYIATAPPPLPPPVSSGLGPYQSSTLPQPSPSSAPYAPSPNYSQPTQYGTYPLPSKPQHGHGHSSSLSIPNMSGLSLGGASPALQAYQGTYQNISPLPSPSASPSSYSPSSSNTELGGFSLGAPLVPPPKKETTEKDESYDPHPHAKELVACLNHTISRIDPGPIIKILPKLTPSQLTALRAEYKRLLHQVNIAKHIKMQCGTGAFGKVAWAVALGPYESEAWFANTWYQKAVTRNELLIEALLGKTVVEIRKIKKGFKDDKYGNSLERAIKNELPSSKFRGLILMVLDTDNGIRDEEPEGDGYMGSVWGHHVQTPGGIKMDKVHDDVRRLNQVLDGRPGTGETVLMEILACRSLAHVREIIRWYRQMYGKDLSKVVIKHSPNLVGEALTHLLSGLIDKPLRDAKLIEDAINGIMASENPKDDLFISRLVRVHWEKEHARRVKVAYARKFRKELVDRIKEAVGRDRPFRDFLVRMLE
ncbi:hypothetical protein BDZ91DRAFT_792077 [Kalaharituber pfeilii]|nr:hypothetical protein BDZ91DRAFT_792077 [Kalaharituber pfeilii]